MNKKIRNTTKLDPAELLLEMMVGDGAIEHQEARGQEELVNSSQLPRKQNSHHDLTIEKHYKKMGVKIVEDSGGDDLFMDVILPEGWKLESTDHSMWNKLVDDKGRERASIFYKAAFYDRDAFINFNRRFYPRCDEDFVRNNEDGPYERINASTFYGRVYDGEKVVFETKPETYKVKYEGENSDKKHREWWAGYEQLKTNLRKKAIEWLKKNKYKKYENPHAYWD